MKFLNLNNLDDQDTNLSNNLESYNQEDNNMDYLENENDHPRGWSYICLDETINYYINHNTKN